MVAAVVQSSRMKASAIFPPVSPADALQHHSGCSCWLVQGPAASFTLLSPNPSLKYTLCTLLTMANREDLVYQAKLAEQAERYDGKINFKEEREREP